MFKFIFATAVFLVFGYVGFTIYNHYKNKQEIIKSFNDFIEFSRSEIEYMRTDIIKLCKKFCSAFKVNKCFKQILDSFTEKLNLNNNQEEKKVFFLESKDLEVIKNFLNGSTKLVNGNNLGFFEYHKKKAQELFSKATEEVKTKGELYKKLSILVGIFLFILLI